MIWKRIKAQIIALGEALNPRRRRVVDALSRLKDQPNPNFGPTVRDVFRTLSALSEEAVPITTNIRPQSYAYTAKDLVHYGTNVRDARSLRAGIVNLGWLWFSGTTVVDGKTVTYCLPAVSVPVVESADGFGFVPAGDAQISAAVTDTISRLDLLERLNSGLGWFPKRLATGGIDTIGLDELISMDKVLPFAGDVARAIGLEVDSCRIDSPEKSVNSPGIDVHLGVALFESSTSTLRQGVFDLTSLDTMPSLGGTAFNALYGVEEVDEGAEQAELVSFRPMSRRQRSVARELSGVPLSILSGAPGTGKTHLISVTAANAIARGQSVLVLAGSAKAVDVLVEHFANTPGPPPVTFGGSRFGDRLSAELEDLAEMVDESGAVSQILLDAAAAHDERAARIRRFFETLDRSRRVRVDPAVLAETKAELDRAGDLDEVAELIERLDKPGLWPVDGRLNKRLGCVDGADAALDRLRAFEDALSADPHDPSLTADHELDDLAENEIDAALVGGELLTALWIDSLDRADKAVLKEIAAAILVNRSERRRLLSELDPEALTKAAPLWVGSLNDVDDVLPSIIGLFDLVIFDEASQIDQVSSITALVRAKKALICGDPQQIGFEPYLSTAAIERAKRSYRTSTLPLNPQKQSLFDAGAAKFAVAVLDEHFRSAPHLIEFSSRRLYDGGLFTATRHPSNEVADHIDLSVVDGERNADGVNEREVSECMRILAEHFGSAWRSIGIITPSTEQADAFEAAVRAAYTLDQIEERGLRVGTVKEFQGDEVDFMIMSFAVGGGEPASAWASVNDPRFFNVMVTRAREHVHVVTSNPDPPGLAGEYVKWSEPLVDLVRDEVVSDAWTLRVADALRAAGISVRTGYRVGRYVVDVVAGEGERAVAIDCTLSSDGVDAHIDRALMLRRTGWRTADAFEEKWQFLLDEYADDLTQKYADIAV